MDRRMILEKDDVREHSLSLASSTRIGGTDTLCMSRVGSRSTCIRIWGYYGIANPVYHILDPNRRCRIREAQSNRYVTIMLLQRRRFNFIVHTRGQSGLTIFELI
jgi:hypothetical protein